LIGKLDPGIWAEAEIETLLAKGRKVEAIYHYRDATGVDLTTAFAVVKAVGAKK